MCVTGSFLEVHLHIWVPNTEEEEAGSQPSDQPMVDIIDDCVAHGRPGVRACVIQMRLHVCR